MDSDHSLSIFAVCEGVKSAALRFAAASAWEGYVIRPFGALAEATSDAQIEVVNPDFSVQEHYWISYCRRQRCGKSVR